jgi:nitrite reductase/ring-hydroxylating ferredoxin subunit
MHAGAALDNAVEEDNRLSCPWHGKLIEPYAEIEDGKITRAQDPTAMKISVRDGQVTVESRAV